MSTDDEVRPVGSNYDADMTPADLAAAIGNPIQISQDRSGNPAYWALTRRTHPPRTPCRIPFLGMNPAKRRATLPRVDSVSIGIIGDRDPAFAAHVATDEALRHSARALNRTVEIEWLATDALAAEPERASRFDGLLCAPGSPYRSLDGALAAVHHGRTSAVPLLGTCGGFQHVVLEYARNVLGIADAAHAEYDPYASNLFVDVLTCSLAGRTMQVHLTPGSRVADAYDRLTTEERYYCNFGLTREAAAVLDAGGLRITGVDQDGEPRVVELPQHPFFVATLFVPQTSSTAEQPHPLVTRFVDAAG